MLIISQKRLCVSRYVMAVNQVLLVIKHVERDVSPRGLTVNFRQVRDRYFQGLINSIKFYSIKFLIAITFFNP